VVQSFIGHGVTWLSFCFFFEYVGVLYGLCNNYGFEIAGACCELPIFSMLRCCGNGCFYPGRVRARDAAGANRGWGGIGFAAPRDLCGIQADR
ncbi:MAG TPA: hypothetical protein PKK10_07530, partial [Woeseiaceae bacterium]|nr:hypothetical protein [Woeseiaceae bacterium]